MSKYDYSLFVRDLKEFEIDINDKQIEQFADFYDLLLEWNSFMNLTSITDFHEVNKKHFLDSVSLVKACNLTKEKRIIDVGTGAGFPGIPLKILFPNLHITLLDSLNKRVKFLKEVIGVLGLKDIEAVHGRAEDFAKDTFYREKYNLCVSRAVANLSTLSEYCLPFVEVGGKFISYKSEKIVEEKETAGNAILKLGGKIEKQIDFLLPTSDIYRNLLVFEKIKATPKQFPRKAGLPSKEPLQ